MIKADEFLRIKQASEIVGVSQGTLRNWSRQGKIRTHRHPINHYRLYRRSDLENLLHGILESVEGGRQ